jgi:hypothetical protein
VREDPAAEVLSELALEEICSSAYVSLNSAYGFFDAWRRGDLAERLLLRSVLPTDTRDRRTAARLAEPG